MNPYEPPHITTEHETRILEKYKSAGRREVLWAVLLGASVAFGIVLCWRLLESSSLNLLNLLNLLNAF